MCPVYCGGKIAKEREFFSGYSVDSDRSRYGTAGHLEAFLDRYASIS